MLPLNACFDEFASLYYIALCTTVSVSIGQIRNKETKTSACIFLNVKIYCDCNHIPTSARHSTTKSLTETNSLYLLPKTLLSMDNLIFLQHRLLLLKLGFANKFQKKKQSVIKDITVWGAFIDISQSENIKTCTVLLTSYWLLENNSKSFHHHWRFTAKQVLSLFLFFKKFRNLQLSHTERSKNVTERGFLPVSKKYKILSMLTPTSTTIHRPNHLSQIRI